MHPRQPRNTTKHRQIKFGSTGEGNSKNCIHCSPSPPAQSETFPTETYLHSIHETSLFGQRRRTHSSQNMSTHSSSTPRRCASTARSSPDAQNHTETHTQCDATTRGGPHGVLCVCNNRPSGTPTHVTVASANVAKPRRRWKWSQYRHREKICTPRKQDKPRSASSSLQSPAPPAKEEQAQWRWLRHVSITTEGDTTSPQQSAVPPETGRHFRASNRTPNDISYCPRGTNARPSLHRSQESPFDNDTVCPTSFAARGPG